MAYSDTDHRYPTFPPQGGISGSYPQPCGISQPRQDFSGDDEVMKPSLVALLISLILLITTPSAAYSSGHHHNTPTTPSITIPDAGSWLPPVSGATVSDVLKGFDPPEKPWSPGHRGIDIAIPADDEVVAPADATVEFAGPVAGRSVLTLKHSDGLLSSFEPVETDLNVGDSVSAGDPIATLQEGVQHCDTSCVHWGVRLKDGWHIENTIRDLYLDPQFLVGWAGPSILWPLSGDPPH